MRVFIIISILTASLVFAQEGRINVPYERIVLPNGLNVIFHRDDATPTVSVNCYYHVGSGREKPGRTGFAHLFEHIMFEGSAHVPEGKFDQWLEAAGGDNNGSTNTDRTNYWENVPSNAVELPLFLESDRMGYLLTAMSLAKVDGQRDVVKNERRQSYENRPYGLSEIVLLENLYPPKHPYHWPTIGSMKDLSAASFKDVVDFFKSYYGPNNASLVIAGDIDIAATKQAAAKWFRDVPAGPAVPPLDVAKAQLTVEKRLFMYDNVQLPRLYMQWHSPRGFAPGDAEMDVVANILAGGKNSRLHKRLVYDLQIAQDVNAYQYSQQLGGVFSIEVTARSGHTLAEIETLVQEEINKVKSEPPTVREVQRAVNQYEAGFLARLERVGGFGGKADLLNNYFMLTGNPDYFNEDLARYKALDPTDIQTAVLTYLKDDARVMLSVVPKGKKELVAANAKEVKLK